MRVNCEGCAGCCVDWRPVAPGALDHERRGPRRPLDDTYDLVPLTRDEVRRFVDDGLGDALVPRLWVADADADRTRAVDDAVDTDAAGDGRSVTVDGVELAAIAGRPAFVVGLRKPPKPVAPFGLDRTWLRACAFLDPETLQCRIHDDDRYPSTCADYPGHNLVLGVETECERVETARGEPGERLVDADPPDEVDGLLLGPQAVGAKVFAYPDDPGTLAGTIDRLRRGTETSADRARFVAAAAAAAPGTLAVDDDRRRAAREATLAADSWVGRAIDEWESTGVPGSAAVDAPSGDAIEVARGAPPTPGWDAARRTTGDAGGNG